jgi:hypothetical protein
MDTTQTEQTTSGLDVAAYVVSLASLLGTVVAATFVLPIGHSGLHASLAVFVFFIFLLQLLGLVLAVGVPALIQALRRRFRMSRGAFIMVALALAGVAAEGLALTLIPVTGNC